MDASSPPIYFTGKNTVLSTTLQYIDPVLKCASLLVVVPNHGTAEYKWERECAGNWVTIDIPKNVCVLYVRDSGKYRCQVAGEEHYFEVKGVKQKYCYYYSLHWFL